jgi:DNA repair exonuclease SbcCD ATPase subunit
MTDSEKKQFLMDLLGLDQFQALAETCDSNIYQLSADHANAKAAYEARLSVVPPEPSPVKLLPLGDFRANVNLTKAQVSDAENVLAALKERDEELTAAGALGEKLIDDEYRLPFAEAMAKYEAIKSETPSTPDLDKKLSWLQGEMNRRKTEHASKEGGLLAAIQGYRSQARDLERVQADIYRLTQEREALLGNVCPTCQRAWDNAGEKARDLAVHLSSLGEKLKVCEKAQKDLDDAEAKLNEHRKLEPIPQKMKNAEQELLSARAAASATHRAKVAEAKSEVDSCRAWWNDAKRRAAEMTPEHRKVRDDMGLAQNLLSQARQAHMVANVDLRDAQRRNEQAEAEYAKAVQQRTSAAEVALDFGRKLDALQKKLDAEQDYKALLRGFLGLIFDETLARVSDLTTDRLAKIPNVSGLTISFESERETQKGTVKQTIHPVVRKDGNVIPLKAGVSGGMYSAVELAVDLSLADVIAERTGVRPGWLILDEAFEGLDTVCKAACFEMLREASSDRLVMVIDHTREFTEMFDQVLLVKHIGGRSTVGR